MPEPQAGSRILWSQSVPPPRQGAIEDEVDQIRGCIEDAFLGSTIRDEGLVDAADELQRDDVKGILGPEQRLFRGHVDVASYESGEQRQVARMDGGFLLRPTERALLGRVAFPGK